MKLTVTLQLDNMPIDTDPAAVADTIRRQVAEGLDFDQHPEDLHIYLERTL